MKILLPLAILAAGLAQGCSSSQTPTEGPEGPTPTATIPADPPPPEATSAPVSPPGDAADPTKPELVEPDPVKHEERPAEGRLAFQACSEGSRKVKGCTKEHRPVCAEMDTGIVCVRAPCPSTASVPFANACTACAEPKVRGYWPLSCEEMKKSSAP